MVLAHTPVMPMTLLRCAPRPIYRIYSEEEFFTEPEFALVGQASPGDEPKGWVRLAAFATLATVLGAVAAVVVLNRVGSRSGHDRRFADSAVLSEPLETHSRAHVRQPPGTVRRASRRRTRRTGGRTMPVDTSIRSVTPAARASSIAKPASAAAGVATGAAPAAATAVSAVAERATATAVTTTSTHAPAATPVSTATRAAPTASVSAVARGAGSEFGFERR
jgi:hypothetical protein